MSACPSATPVWRFRLLRRFADDRSGAVAIIFALSSIVVFAIAGGAIDYSRWTYSRNTMQNAIDAAVLAGARELQVNNGNESIAIESAKSTYLTRRAKYIKEELIVFEVANSGQNFRARGNAYVQTPFMSVVGVPKLPVFEEGNRVRAEAVWAAGSNSQTNIEMSLMLDTTGSMAGQRIKDLKDAAVEMIDIVVWEDQSGATSRMALAPFSSAMNVGGYIDALIDPAVAAANDKAKKAQCVVERTGVAEAAETAPGQNAWFPSYNVVTHSGTSSCPEEVEIVPLTRDKAVLKAAVADLKAKGSTAGALGTAWAWYMLSPQWANVWPASATPAPYSQLSEIMPSGAPRLLKIAVLMTDGAYNTFQTVQNADNSNAAQQISQRAVDLCAGMKAKGITVYTVGFQLDWRSPAARCWPAQRRRSTSTTPRMVPDCAVRFATSPSARPRCGCRTSPPAA